MFLPVINKLVSCGFVSLFVTIYPFHNLSISLCSCFNVALFISRYSIHFQLRQKTIYTRSDKKLLISLNLSRTRCLVQNLRLPVPTAANLLHLSLIDLSPKFLEDYPVSLENFQLGSCVGSSGCSKF